MPMLTNGLYLVTVMENMGRKVKAGFQFKVACDSTGGPSFDDLCRAFYLATGIDFEESNRNQYFGKLSPGSSSLKLVKIADWSSDECQELLKEQWQVHRDGVLYGGNKKDEEDAKEKRKEKKEKEKEKKKDDKGCCGAWYCCPFRCSWKILCSFLG